ncbi:prolipoprotein diacylglyceryl transferase [Bryobacter aggregatus]|uniref:prolipoprotein diacylglyceryl transferase n=1 Tax=Bryobacter aggregatus TaxID=360054 RepID=UPI0004E0BFC9|nr:prolipoprotein diacylglyceryl transferase [Bryobacter aggregatus]
MLPKLVEIGGFFIPTYGVMVALAFLAGLWSTNKLAARAGLSAQKIQDLVIYCAITGLIGAKLMMFAFDWQYYVNNPAEMISLSTLRAAGVYQGGFLLALVFAVYYMRKHGLPVLKTMDCFAPGIALGHAIGRMGCFAAGCCYGDVCHRPWAVTFRNPEAKEFSNVPLNVPLHPAQLYEVFGDLAIFAILFKLHDPRKRSGGLFGLYLILYSILRFGVEFVRHHDQPPLFTSIPLVHTQWISLGTLMLGAWLLFRPAKGPISE